MNLFKSFPLVSALAVLAASPLLAQKVGEPTRKAQQPAAELRLPTFVKAPLGADALVRNEAEQVLGVVRDHVIDRRTGQVVYMAVGSAVKKDAPARLVPYDRFTWRAGEKRLMLLLTPQELAALPVYDAEKLPPVGERAAAVAAVAQTRPAVAPLAQPYVTSSEALGSHIHAAREKFAKAHTLVLEPKRGTIAFVLARDEAPKSDPYIIPWAALSWQVPVDDETEGRFVLMRTQKPVQDAPKLVRGDLANLAKRDALATIYGFYKLVPPLALNVKAATIK